ncbi:MAG TPA: hypothetical protein VK453_20205 [Micromonosporaceae bacterium]|nr:hypothetical protein [Micromonosporaceae bacterium]
MRRSLDERQDALGYQPGPQSILTAEFASDPDRSADQAVVVLRFLGAQILSWRTDPDEDETYRDRTAPGGQCSDLSWDGARTFGLELLTVSLALTAHTVEVSTRS